MSGLGVSVPRPQLPPLEGNFALPSRSVSPNGKAGTRGPVAEKQIPQGAPQPLPYYPSWRCGMVGGLEGAKGRSADGD